MKLTTEKLKKLFDYQKFERNEELQKEIDSSRSAEALNDKVMSLVFGGQGFSSKTTNFDEEKAKLDILLKNGEISEQDYQNFLSVLIENEMNKK